MTVFADNPKLLMRFRAGDRDALSTVYWFYVARVESVLRRGLRLAGDSTAARIRSDMADLVQEVFVRAFAESARSTYDGIRAYRPLLMTIARNALVDHLRRVGREQQLASVQMEEMLEPETFAKDEVDWADPQTMALVEHYIAGLPAQEHAVYVQRYGQGRSQLQAATALGLTRQQVRTLEQHVRMGLVRELARAKLTPRAPAEIRSAPLLPRTAFVHVKSEDP